MFRSWRYARQLVPGTLTPDTKLPALTAEDYQQAAQKVVSHISSFSGVQLIAQFGHVRLPGVSDLDIFVVVDDAVYADISESLKTLSDDIPHGNDVLVHQALLLPASLLPDRRRLFFAHHGDAPTVLHGDPSLLEQEQEPTQEEKLLNTIIWATTVWSIIDRIPHNTQNLRQLLLLLETISRTTKLLYAYTGDEKTAVHIQEWSRIARQQVLASRYTEQSCIQALRKAIQMFLSAEARVQSWWTKRVVTDASSWKAPVFTHVPSLSSYYRDVSSLFTASFCPHLDFLSLQKIEIVDTSLQEAIRNYSHAIERAKDAATMQSLPPYTFFLHDGKGLFPSPFNLAHA